MEASVTDQQDEPVEDRRSVDQLRTRLEEIQSRQVEIDGEFQGALLSGEAEDEFERLQEEKVETERLVAQLEERADWIARSSERSNGREVGAAFHTSRPSAVKGDDIYDLSTLRAGFADPAEGKRELRDRALRSIETMRPAHPITEGKEDNVRSHIERLIAKHDNPEFDNANPGVLSRQILQGSAPLYRKAFVKACAGQALSSDEQRALSLTGASGGYAIPTTLDPTIIPTSSSSVNPTRAIARIETLVGSNTWTGVSSAGITAARAAEATAATDNTPTLVAPTATVTKAHAFVPFSIEVGQDWGSLESEMAVLFQDAKDDEEATQFVTGVGTTVYPQGFVVGTTSTVAAAGSLAVTAANVYALEAALPARHRARSTIVANRGIYNVVRAIDTAGGAALWMYISEGLTTQAPTPGNTGATLLGRPAYESSAMQATVVNATKIMVIGDFKKFLILDRVGMTVEVIPHLFGAAQGDLPTGQRGLYAYWRNTSKVLDAGAFRALTGTT